MKSDADHTGKLNKLRALIDEGDRALAERRTTAVKDPEAFAADVIAKGLARHRLRGQSENRDASNR